MKTLSGEKKKEEIYKIEEKKKKKMAKEVPGIRGGSRAVDFYRLALLTLPSSCFGFGV